MIKTAKKLLGILLALSMMFSLYVPVIAAETVTASIVGDTVLFAPPADVFSKVQYTVKPETGTAQDVVWSLSKTVAGVSVNTNTGALILDGAKIAVSSFTLTAAGTTSEGATFTASLDISIPDVRFDYNFDDLTEGTTPASYAYSLSAGTKYSAVLNGQPSGKIPNLAKESDGNIYVPATGWQNYIQYEPAKLTAQADNIKKAKQVTMSVKLKKNGTGTYTIKENTGNTAWYFRVINGVFNERYGIVAENGSVTSTSDTSTGATISSTVWTTVDIAFDFREDTYSAIVDGVKVSDSKPMRAASQGYFTNTYFENYMDDIAFYSGEPVAAALAANMPEKLAVGSNGVKMPLPSVAKLNIGGSVSSDTDIVWELKNAVEGVSITDNKYLCINENAVGEEITLTADGGRFTADYPIDLCAAIEATSNVTVPVSVLGGISVIKATLSGSNVVLKGLGKDINITGTDLSVYIDGFEKSYIVICDKKTVDKGSYTTLSDISLENATVTELYAGGIYDEAPMALDARLSTDPIVGQNVGVSYTYFSKLYEKTGHEITWTLRNGESVEETRTADTFTIEKPMTGKTLQASVIVRGGGKESEPFYTETKTIKDVYTVSLSGNSVNVEILSIEAEAEDNGFIIGVEWMKDGQSVGTLAKAIEYVGSLYTITADTAIDDARVWLMYNNLTPIAGDKYASGKVVSYESSGKTQNGLSYEDGSLYVYDTSGGMTTVVIYKPKEDADFALSQNFPFGILGEDGEVELNNYISYMGVIAPDAKIPFDTSLSGLYKAAAITQSNNEPLTAEFIIGKEKLFTQNKLQTLTEVQFDKVMTLTGATADHSEYQKAEPSDVSTLMQAEGYDMAELETAILVSAFLEDKANKETLTAHLKARTLPTAGAELLSKNLDFAASAALVKLDGGIEKALESMLETAILQGVAKSGNYLETKPYLEAAGDYTVSDAMALSFTGKTYGTLTELKAAIEGYTETPSGSDVLNPDSTESTGGSLTGSSPAGGIVGGNGGGGGGGSSSSEKESDAEDEIQDSGTIAFNDVSSAHWAYEDIAYLVRKEIISGMGDGSFAPDSSITRAQYVKILAGAFPMNEIDDAAEFTDVDKSAWYYSFIKKASAAGIVTGDGQCFRPDASITRQDAAVMLYRVLSALNVRFDDTQCNATDSSDISSYALQAVNSLYGAGIINGMADGSFKPKNNITRAQAAAIVARVLK